jgi:nucleoside-diphosphate-sugar epimerase
MTGAGPRLLILGASGFLGRHVARQAREAGLSVVTAGRSATVTGAPHRRVDLTADDSGLAAALAAVAPDVVINCAGATGGPPGQLAAVNVTGTATLVRALLVAPHRPRLVHLGSAAEYGPCPSDTAVPESAPARPANVYGVTKLAATELIGVARSAGLDAVVLRVFNPVGPGAPAAILPGRVAAEVRRALDTGTPVSLGPLDAVRDFVDARDVADAALAAALAPALTEPVLNVGSGTGRAARDLVDALVAISGYDGPVREGDDGSPRSDSRSWQQADIARARRALGWAPRRDLVTSLADLWEDAGAPISRLPGRPR